jgi:hypothetical protein
VSEERHSGASFSAAADGLRGRDRKFAPFQLPQRRAKNIFRRAELLLQKEAFKRAEKELAAIRGIPAC